MFAIPGRTFNTLPMFRNYFKTAFRHLLKNKAHSIINLTGLSVGIACTIVITVFVSYESGFDQHHAKSTNTFRVVQHTQFPEQLLFWNTTCYPLAEALRNDFPDFAHVTQTAGPMKRFFSVDRGNSDVVRFEDYYVMYVDTAYARVFDLEWLAGNAKQAFALKNSIILTESIVTKAFGTGAKNNYPSVIGKTILLNGKDPLTVTGIVKDAPGNVNLRYNLLVPYEFFKENNQYQATNWSGNYRGTTFVVLKDNNQEQDIESKIAGWKKKYMKPEDDARINYFLQPINEIHNETRYGNAPGSYTMPKEILRSSALVGIIILVIAAVNFVNLTTAKAITRSKEVGIRKVMGSTRFKLVMQFIYEHSLLIIVTMAISVGLSQLAIDQLNGYLTSINLKLAFTWKDAGVVVATGLSVVLLAAVYPAMVLSSFKPVEAIRNKIGFVRQGFFSLRRVLIVFQFTVVQLLIIATIVVAVQINHFNSTDLGFVTESILSIPVPKGEQRDAFRNRLLENKDVAEVTFGSNAPIGVDGNYGTSFREPSQPVEEGKEAQMKVADLQYVSFFDLQLIAGRDMSVIIHPFTEFIVNETLVNSMGWTPEEAIGKRLTINEGEATIVGVVKDFQNTSLRQKLTPCVLMNWEYIQANTYVRLHRQTPETLAAIEATWKEFAPEGVFSHLVLTDALERQYGLETMVFHGFTVFSMLSILIGCLGLFGLSSFLAIRRAKEIGIRKVMGADVAQIVAVFASEFVWMVIVGFLVAAPASYFLMKGWLEGFAHRVDLGWWMFAAGGVLALLIAIATVSFHSIRAGLANPVDSLRNE